jgi:glucokinase
MDNAVVLAADVGGTKIYLGMYAAEKQGPRVLCEARYDTAGYAGLGDLLVAFIQESGFVPARVALGVPGPVRITPVKPVNIPWQIDPMELSRHLGVEVDLLNDLQATSYGVLELGKKDLMVLNEGVVDPEGNIAVIAAGTGLGEGGLCWSGERYVAVASEGGHASFAPGTHQEMALWRYLFDRFGHVSWERVVSGPGLVRVYEFLRDTKAAEEPEWLRQELEAEDSASVISRVALEERCDLATQTLDLFTFLYGAEAGNLALKLMATGGVYIGGGIAPKILQNFHRDDFMRAFTSKGRMAEPLGQIPVKIILNDKTALLGAAHWAVGQVLAGG